MKTGREAGGGDFAFLEVNDGSTFSNLQARALPGDEQIWASGDTVVTGPSPRVVIGVIA